MHSTAIGPTKLRPLTKPLLVMKMTAILLLAGLLQVAARSTAQVTLKEKSATLIEVLTKIKKQSGYGIVYDGSLLRAKARPVVITLNDVPVEKALEEIFKTQDRLSYSVADKIISVKEKKITAPVVEVANAADVAPPPTVRGRITNEKGEPVAGVSIAVKGGKVIGVSNDNGEFLLSNVPDNATLVFSAVTIETFETKLNGRVELALSMKTKVSALDEIQVIAYGQTSKRLQTGNVTTVKGEDIAKQPVNNPLLALAGRVPGLVITQGSGLPGSSVSVRIQGQNSITSGNEPLFVIDGVPYASSLLPSTLAKTGQSPLNGGNPFSSIDPNSIESIEVLKDADATAIYGSRAANGAILITTKKGKAGVLKTDLNLQTGWGKVTRTIEFMNTQQYLQMRREAFVNDGVVPGSTAYDINGFWDTTRYTDWQKELIGGTAKYSDMQSSFSGGSANVQYFFGASYHKETTVYPVDFGYTKASVNFNVNAVSANQKFSFRLSGIYTNDLNNLPAGDITSTATTLPPNAPALYNADGSINWALNAAGAATWTNPVADLQNNYLMKTKNLVTNATIGYKLFRGFEIKSNFGYSNLQNDEFSAFRTLRAARPENVATLTRVSYFANNGINSWIVEPQITYKREFNGLTTDVLIGTTFQQFNNFGQQVAGLGFNNDDVMKNILSASSVVPTSSSVSTYKYSAAFGRLSTNYNGRYLLTVNVRRDGSSRFGENSQFHNFGSLGIGWIFSEEAFIKNHLSFVSFGKLRGSYGTTGNDQIGDYKFLSLYNTVNPGVPYQGSTGLAVNGLPNPYLQWEETKKTQVGLDLGFVKDRILLTLNYISNRSSNQLLQYSLPITTGTSGIVQNFPATVQNSAWEFSASTINIKGTQFSWTTGLNITIPKNKLVSFPGIGTSTYASTLVIGEPVSIQKAYRFAGVNPTTGIYQFTDANGNLTANPNYNTDRTVLINTLPTLYGGLQNSFSYKGFQLEFFLQFVKQTALKYIGFSTPGTYARSQTPDIMSRWQRPGDITTVQKFSQNGTLNNAFNNLQFSDYGYSSDASFVRLKNVSLGWEIPAGWKRKAKLLGCQVYLHAQNLLTLTKYSGMDPESQSRSSLPPLRIITTGIKVTL